MIAQRPACVADACDAYKEPMRIMDSPITAPPRIMEARRPPVMRLVVVKVGGAHSHWSAKNWTMNVQTTLIRPDTPEATNDAVEADRPACENRSGAY